MSPSNQVIVMISTVQLQAIIQMNSLGMIHPNFLLTLIMSDQTN